MVVSTRSRKPFKLLFVEKFATLGDARRKEWQLKYTPWGGKLKKQLALKAAGSSNGRTLDSESKYLGSNPSPAALGDRGGHKNT